MYKCPYSHKHAQLGTPSQKAPPLLLLTGGFVRKVKVRQYYLLHHMLLVSYLDQGWDMPNMVLIYPMTTYDTSSTHRNLELTLCYMSILFTVKAAESSLSVSWVFRKIIMCCSFSTAHLFTRFYSQTKSRLKRNVQNLVQQGIFLLSCYSCSIVKVRKRPMCIYNVCILFFLRTRSAVKAVCKKTQMKKSAHKSI